MAVLVVDPDPSYLDFCRMALPYPRFDLRTAQTFAEAELALAERAADVAVCALELGERDGIVLLATLSVRFPDTARILVTVADSLLIANQAHERSGAFRVLYKPHSIGLLREAVESAHACRHIALHRPTPPHPSVSAPPPAAQAAPPIAIEILEHILNAVPIGVIGIDRVGSINLANVAARSLLGTGANEVEGGDPGALGLPCAGCRTGGWLNRQTAKLFKYSDARGAKKILLWSCESMRGAEAETLGCVAAFQDVTDRKLLEKKVFIAKQEIEAIFDSETDPTFLVDAKRTIRRANRAFLKLAGRPFDKVIGIPCSEALAEHKLTCERCPLDEVFKTGAPSASRFGARGGRVYSVNYSPVSMQGKPVGVVVRYHDITAEKEMEAQLLQSEKMAAVGQLVAGVAHEINNPVSYILSNLGVLKGYIDDVRTLGMRLAALSGQSGVPGSDPAEALRLIPEYLREANLDYLCDDAESIMIECIEGTERIHRIAGDLKVFSRKGGDKPESADLNEVVESTLNIVWNELKYKCEVVRDFAPLPKVLCNPQQIGQVLINILLNASQAIRERGKITITTRPEGEGVAITVADDGVGIPKENLDRLFEAFFTTKPAGQGLGLGLNLSAKFVRAHGGKIEVTSTEGVGSVFKITLPTNPQQEEEPGEMPENG